MSIFVVFSTGEIQVLGELRSGVDKLENYLRMYMLQGIYASLSQVPYLAIEASTMTIKLK